MHMQEGAFSRLGYDKLVLCSRLHMALPVYTDAMQASCDGPDVGCHLRPLA